MSPYDSKAMTEQCEHFTPPTLQQQEQARKTVCAFATDADDAAELLKMLGLYPGQETDDVPVNMVSELRSAALM